VRPSELERLIQDALDGVATPEERSRLEATLERQPETRARYREVEGLFASLGRVPTEDPPAGFQTEILRTIRERGRKPAARSWVRSWTGQPGQRPALALAPFAFGLVAGALVLAAWMAGLGPGREGRQDLGGTMMPPSEARAARWQIGSSELRAQSWRHDRRLFLRLQVRSDHPVAVDLDYGRQRHLAQARQSPGSGNRLGTTPGHVSWEASRAGEIQLELIEAGPSPDPLRATVRSAEGEREVVVPLAPPADETR